MDAFIDFLIDNVILPELKKKEEKGADGNDGYLPENNTDRTATENIPLSEKLVS